MADAYSRVQREGEADDSIAAQHLSWQEGVQRDDVQRILSKRGVDRTPAELQTLVHVTQRVPLFTRLSPSEREALCSRVFTATYDSGQVIVLQGDVGSEMFIIASVRCIPDAHGARCLYQPAPLTPVRRGV